jgi:RHS repeat-associated protein
MMETKVVSNATTSEWEYIWFNGQPAVQIDSSTGDMAWYFNDHLGTPILQTDATATEIWHVERDPYGTPFATITGPTRHQPLAFPGQEQNGELSYNIFRWYRSGWGRYTQADPLDSALAGLVNGYRYANSNPLTFIDTVGLQHASDWRNCGDNISDCIRLYKCNAEARRAAFRKFNYEGDGNPSNAFKHCYWNCCMAKIAGPSVAKRFGDAHEDVAGNLPCNKDMDLWNNDQGRRVTGSTTCESHCSSVPLKEWSTCNQCGRDPWRQLPPQPSRPTAPVNCAVVNGKTVCVGTGI